jgi:CHAT domain-containing protein/cytochrome c peroxidase
MKGLFSRRSRRHGLDPRELLRTIFAFVQARNWDESRRVAEEHPELLTDEADELMGHLVEAAHTQGDKNGERILEEHRALLRRCKELGAEAAFAEKTGTSGQSFPPEGVPEEARQFLEAMATLSPEQRESLEDVFAQVRAAGVSSPEEVEAFFDAHPDLRAALEEALSDTAGGTGISIPPEFREALRRSQEALQRYLRTSDQTALDDAATAWDHILHHAAFTSAPERFQLTALNEAGRVFLRRYWAGGHLDDLNQSLTCWLQAVQRMPPDSPDLPFVLNNLGAGLRDRYTHTGRLEDLEEAIRVYQQAIQRTPPDSPNLPSILNNLGNGLRERYAHTGRLEDLEEAIRVCQRAVQRTPHDSPDLALHLNNLGAGLHTRYAHTGRLEDLERAIRAYRRAVQRTPSDSPDLALHLNNLGAGLRDRYVRTGRLEDLEETIRTCQQAVQRTPPGSPDLPRYLNNLGNGLSERYARTGRLEDLEEAIRTCHQAVQRAPSDSPDLPGYLNNLGTGLSERYARTGRLEDLEEAIRTCHQAVQRTPPASPDLPRYLSNLGGGLRARYAHTGRLEDLEKAIRVYQRVVQLTHQDSPDIPSILSNLGIGLRDRYAHTGRLEDLEEAIRVYRRAVQLAHQDSPELPGYLNNLGGGLRDRYAHTGRLEDLEETIRACQQAVQLAPPDSPEFPGFLNNLGTGLSVRYARTGRLEDLEEAIRVYERVVQITPQDSPGLALHLNNLGAGLRDRYVRTGRLEDLEKAIHICQRAVQRTPSDSPNLPRYLNNLGNGLRDRYIRTERLEGLEEAIRVYQRVIQLIPPDSPDLSSILNNLGAGLHARYVHTGRLEDLEEAIRTCQQAVQRTPPDSPNFPAFLNNLGTGLRDRYIRTGRLEDLEEATGIYQQSLAAMDRAFLLSPVAYQLGQQTQWAGLIARAVETHRQAGKVAQALTIAEGNKSRLLTVLLGRGDLPVPPAIPRDLVRRERTRTQRLAALDAADLARHGRTTLAGEGAARQQRLQHRKALVDQLQVLWQEMEGYGSVARDYVALRKGDRPAWKDLAHLAGDLGNDTALLSLFTTGVRTLLFVLRAGMDAPEVVHVALSTDELRYDYLSNYVDEIVNRRVHRAAGRPFTHRWQGLGQRLLAPVAPLLDDIGHLVVIPEGLFHLLPLHALPLDADGETLLDRFTISYIPAASVLDRLRRREPIVAGETTALGYTSADPSTERGQAERDLFLGEAQDVADQLRVQPLLDAEADAAHLRDALRERTLRLVHLSCHGWFDPEDPLQSGVRLADGPFTARQWMELRFRADLVTLSACQTGMSGSLGGDEMAGLSQALLYAGASSLLLGLWSVDARTTAALMVDFYQRLWDKKGVKRTDEATALRKAALALREGHLLPPSEDLDPSDPYYWAPFVLVGDWR